MSVRLTIYRMNGQPILNKSIQFSQGQNELIFDKSILKHSGIYFIQLIGKNLLVSQKLIVQ